MKTMKIVGGIFAAVGLLMLLGAVALFIAERDFKKTAIETEATIIRMTDNGESVTVFVEFFVNEERYEGRLGYYSSNMYIGKTVSVYYNPQDPNDFCGSFDFVGVIILSILGLVFGGVGGGMVASVIIKKIKKKRVMAYNYIISGVISNVDVNRSIAVNGRNPFIIEASYQNPLDGLFYYFKSDHIWQDITPIIKQMNITAVPIYVNPNNYKEYYMHTDTITQYIAK